jgi:Soluble NSF attachment protein, SNAP
METKPRSKRLCFVIDALTAMIAAVALDKANGSYRIAARHLEEVAQIYHDKLDEPQKAYDYYDEASNLYHADNSPTYVKDTALVLRKKKPAKAMRHLSASLFIQACKPMYIEGGGISSYSRSIRTSNLQI